MNYFYEISESVADFGGFPSRYVAIYDARDASDAVIAGGFTLTSLSDRIWKEKDGVVRFVKHRFADIPLVQVDMEEFMMIKLKAAPK